ncbi:ABC transporter ATP-binding protein [Acinetobacter pullicarnis]|uniref:ABC transporter ATP-binding protein n=1 Tax=Acinetobacter pullicarnis TaxID=2576829 RepID=UPI00112459D1|nr:ATP-binding cassette domain-containing protein [Acinetobacter pullicarnis]
MQIPMPFQDSAQDTSHLLSTLKTYACAQQQATILEVLDIQKHFEKFQALSHIHLELKAGEFVSFLGPSGCGKTTLLRIIAGLEQPDYGKVIKKGQDITQQSVEKRRCGIVFQNYALFPNLTVAENIGFGLHARQWSRVERSARVQQLLDLIELPNIADKYPNQLSGGQQQRVALARAIAPKPDLLLLDEPLSALDAQVRLTLRQKIKTIQKQLNLPTIMVTHDQEEALSISDRVVVMNHGVIEQVDTPHNIYYKPQTQFVAQFIGSMNFIMADCVAAHQLRILNQASFEFPKLNLHKKQPYIIGFRPEAIQLSAQFKADPDAMIFPIKLLNSEFLGAKRRLFCEIDMNALNQMTASTSVENIPFNTMQATTETVGENAPILQIEIENAAFHQICLQQQHITQFETPMYAYVPKSMLHVFNQQGLALC